MAATFILALVASFFAMAPTALACHSQVRIEKIETGAAAPGLTYTVVMREVNGPVFATVEVPANGFATIERVPPGTYEFDELDAPDGATIVPDEIVVTVEDDQQTFDIVVTNPYPAGKLAIEKIETGDTAPGNSYSFEIRDTDNTVVDTLTVTAG
ncbi:MAG: prealbumin-like fold domain-containing protein, partial [Ilumatobacter sp.]|uniref:MSCRAMM family protein n=1 Tax=Ilumatobacter sp. TaxID=1967498 RepID=UPI00260171D6